MANDPTRGWGTLAFQLPGQDGDAASPMSLEERINHLASVLDSIAYDYLVLARDGRLLGIKPETARSIFGREPGTLLGKVLWEEYPDLAQTEFYSQCQQIVQENRAMHLEMQFRTNDHWYETHLYPRAERVAVYLRDISARKQREQALLVSEQNLREWNQALEQRVAERTTRLGALTAELTQAEQRDRRRLAQILHDHLQQLLVAARFQLSILERHIPALFREELADADGLLVQAIDASRSLTAELSPPILYTAGLPEALHWLARWMGEKYGLQVMVDAGPETNPADEAIRVILFQAVRELLSNVRKHAATDHASLVGELVDAQVRITVQDWGVGMVWDPDRVWADEGVGLLSIRERLMALGGRLEVESAPGQGTRVTLSVPCTRVDQQEAGSMHDGQACGANGAAFIPSSMLRLLLADDHAIVRQGLASIIDSEPGLEVVGEAKDGQEALQLARQLHPDIILMDVSMPVLGGVEATRLILAEMPQTRVIGLSMYDEAETANRMRAAGAVGYMRKGGDVGELLRTVRECARI